ncbi:hypothetical protein Ahy_A03g010455 isoform B [Arachis hypogaea]|uniref:Aminotransferase-like plant mobile domain-containing protein n=1 Tax=Arachis hypogaea TaxID=3818 RepID=A0A445DM59_ARAHY|nr:hypothetical protein Ahy_A03g010455 isoform B [Arachis hypogaea]
MRRQHGMPLDDRIMQYLQMACLTHLASLNDHWFWLDEPLVSAFIERWRPNMHTFHLPFGEYTITLEDVAYQLGLLINGQYVSGCLTDFERYIDGGRLAWVWFEELLGVLLPPDCIDKFTIKCTWMQETFSDLFEGTDEETRARLEDMGKYNWGSTALS